MGGPRRGEAHAAAPRPAVGVRGPASVSGEAAFRNAVRNYGRKLRSLPKDALGLPVTPE